MNIYTFSAINIGFQSLSLILTGFSFTIAILYSVRLDLKLMLLFAGMMLAFVINGLGNLMALIQIYIFPLD